MTSKMVSTSEILMRVTKRKLELEDKRRNIKAMMKEECNAIADELARLDKETRALVAQDGQMVATELIGE